MNYNSVTNLVYRAEDNSIIDCDVDFEGIGITRFTAMASDSVQHGREIYSRAIAGDFGAIAPYVVDPEEAQAEARRLKMAQIDGISVEVNGHIFNGSKAGQTEMANALSILNATGETATHYPLLDGSMQVVSNADLLTALTQARNISEAIWSTP